MLIRKLFATAVLLWAGAASAATVPTSEFYFDADATATEAIVAVPGHGEAQLQRLLGIIERERQPKEATAQLAHIALAGGRAELGHNLYERVLGWLDANERLYRPVLWNYGWDLYRSGDAAGAFEQWHTLLESRPIQASWMPPTFALASWTLGRKDEAVQWYAAAVRTEPGKWRDAGRYAELLPGWRDEERATLAQVQQAWAANPPAWP